MRSKRGIDAGRFKKVGIGRMTNIVEQSCELHQFLVLIAEQTRVDLVEVICKLTCEMVGAQRVSKPIVGCRWKNILAGRKWLNRTQALKFRRINDGCVGCGDKDIAVNFVANHPVPAVHVDPWLNRLLIALFGKG